jgi:hypothetical protein
MKVITQICIASAIVVSVAAPSVWAQQQALRVRATIERVEGDTLLVKTREGAREKLVLKDNVNVRGVVKAALTDIRSGTAVGIASTPQADGTLRAVEIHIFPAGQNINSFHADWDVMPNTFMTNGPVQTTVTSAEGQLLTVQYKAGETVSEKKITVTPQTTIVALEAGTKNDLKAGQKIFVANARKLPDGSFEVPSIIHEKEASPPM